MQAQPDLYSGCACTLDIYIYIQIMSIYSFKNLTYGLGVCLVSNIINSAPVQAQRFTVSPMVTITEARGGQAKGAITISNQGKEPLRMRVYAEDFTYDRKKGFVTIGKHERSAVPYLQFSPRELVIPPGITRNVRVSTTFLPSLPNLEYRAVIFVEDLKERDLKQSNGNAVIIKTRVASVFYTSKGAAQSNLQVSTANWDNDTKKLSVLLTNRGTQSGYPDVNWRIEKDGKEIAKGTMRGILVQSENEREILLTSEGKQLNLSSGNYTFSGKIVTGTGTDSSFSLKFIVP